MRERLVARGLFEARTSKLISRNASAFSKGAVELRNPLSEDHAALRPSLIAGCLECSKEIFARGPRAFRFLKSDAHSSRHRERRNGTLPFCSGEMSLAHRTGDRRQNAASTCLISRARSNALYQIFRFGEENSLVSRSRSKFVPATS